MGNSTVTSLLLVLLLESPLSHGQDAPELLGAVDAYHAQRLVEYNGSWLRAELYFAKRFRIVIPNTSLLLLKEDELSVTPFDDVAPIRLTPDAVRRWEDSVAWNAVMRIDAPAVLVAAGLKPTVMLSVMAWDTDESGNALDSSANRFKYSPYWVFDDLDRPKLETPPEKAEVAGPPPQTPDDIARHKQLLKLKKHAFYSVLAAFDLSPDKKYMLVPLKFTPKYSVIFEVDPEKDVALTVDRAPDGQVTNRTTDDLAKLSAYHNFVRALRPEDDIPVVEDVQ